MAKVTFTHAGDTLIAYLAGEIDHHTAQLLREQIDGQIAGSMPAQLVMDFGGQRGGAHSGPGKADAGAGRQPHRAESAARRGQDAAAGPHRIHINKGAHRQ